VNKNRPRTPRSGRVRLWPYPEWAAFLISGLLLAGLLFLHMHFKWPTPEEQGWILFAIVILGLLPVILLTVTFLASSGATLKGGGLELSFAHAVSQAASTVPTTKLSENLEPPETTGQLSNVGSALRKSHDSDVTIVDLRAGQTWWESRLIILIAGAARRGHPAVIAFIGDRYGTSGSFLGWAEPDRLLQAQLDADPELKSFWRKASAKANQWDCGEPINNSIVRVQYKRLALPAIKDHKPDPDFAFELFLQKELEGQPVNRKTFVSSHRLLALYGTCLVTDSLDDTANDRQWARALTQRSHRYFALTSSAGTFDRLIPREMALSSLTARSLGGWTVMEETAKRDLNR
jgi:hypothetical protein